MRWSQSPAVRFLVLGVMLLAAKHLLVPALGSRRPLLVTQGRMAQLRAEFERATGRHPGAADERALVERAVEEEILYREAISLDLDQNDASIAFRLTEKMRFLGEGEAEAAPVDADLYHQARRLGLHEKDAIVRRITVQKMRLLLSRKADETPPTQRELRAHYDHHRHEYAQPPRLGFWHVFLGSETTAGVEGEATVLLERLRSEATPPEHVRLGMPFPLGRHLQAQSARDLGKVFGAKFATTILSLEPRRWQGPLRSTHGLHLVWLDEIRPERVPPFAEVRSRVLAEYRAQRRTARLREELASLREHWVVRIEDPTEARSS